MVKKADEAEQKAPPRPPKLGSFFALPGVVPVRLAELNDSRCHWPIDTGDEGGTMYCGLPVVRRRYCQVHLKAAFRDQPAPKEQDSTP